MIGEKEGKEEGTKKKEEKKKTRLFRDFDINVYFNFVHIFIGSGKGIGGVRIS